MGALQGAATRSPPVAHPPVPMAGAHVAARSPTLTMGTPESGVPPMGPRSLLPPLPPVPSTPALETVSASIESDDPLFADGKKAMPSGEHDSTPPSSPDALPDPPAALRSGESTSPSGRPFIPDGDAMKAPEGAPPVPDSALIAPPTPRSRARVEPPTPPMSPPPALIEEAGASSIGSFAMSAPPETSAIKASARADPTPLGVISMPAPPSRAATSNHPPPAPRAAGRSFAWILVVLGGASVLGVGGWAAYSRRDQLSLALGLTAPTLTATALEGGAAAVVEGAPDAGTLALIVPRAESDAGLAPVDAWVEPVDAWVVPIDAAVVEATEDSAETPPASGDESVQDLLASASHADAALAEPIYRRVLVLDPREHHAALGLAEILLHRHQPAEAVPLLELVVHRRPGRAEYRVDLGDARRDAGDLEGARAAWREALSVDPENADAHERLGD